MALAEILSQEEINALLAAISGGDDPGAPESPRVAAVPQPERRAEPRGRVRPYDFARPNKLSKDQLRTLQIMHEPFARGIATTLSGYLRSYVQAEVVSADAMTYEEFSRMLPNPGIMAIFSLPPLEGSALLEIDPDLGFAVLDRLLGGPGKAPKQLRELTELEQPVMRRVMEQIIDHLPDAWNQVAPIEPKFQQLELNPQFTHLVPPRDMVVLVRLEVSLNSASGRLNLCIPFDIIEPVVPKLSAHYLFIRGKKEVSPAQLRALRERLNRMLVPVTVILGTATVTVKELVELQVGDYITLDTRTHGALPVLVGSRTKFYGRPGRMGNRMAVEIVEVVPPEEEDA
ncbi:MAG: flagellar motor switch protein FliM [Clostridia bacterium]|nr:flagellar motor switch protein FliM [Bacillota bacterium]MBO2520329.1 flagellar motor switch protein FliM [Bacillota bacterium]